MTLEQLLSIGVLALLDMLSPTMIGVTVYFLLRGRSKLLASLLTYLLTVAILYFTLGAALMLGLDALVPSFERLMENKTVSWTVTLGGGVMFVWSFFMPAKERTLPSAPVSTKPIALVLLGVTTFFIEVATALPYFAAIGIMTTAHIGSSEWLPMLALYNLLMILPALCLLTLYSLFGAWLQAPLEKIRSKLENNKSSAASWALCIVGLILIFNGVDYL